QSKLIGWKTSLAAFGSLVNLRGQNYEPLLPEVDAQFRDQDVRMRLRLEQRTHLARRLKAMLTAPRPEFLATSEERIALDQIALLEMQLGNSDSSESRALRERAAHLRGMLTWRMETEYQERLTPACLPVHGVKGECGALNREQGG